MPGDWELNLEKLIRENLAVLYRYSLRLARGRPDLAEEHLLEAVGRAAESSGVMAATAPDRAWFLGLLTDIGREREAEYLQQPNRPTGSGECGDEYFEGLVRIMDGVDLETRAAWWLGVIEGLGIGEVSQVLELPEAQVEARLERAQGMLRGRLYDLSCAACDANPFPGHAPGPPSTTVVAEARTISAP